MKLSQRMQAVCDTLLNHDVVCDVGCDHGYVSIQAIRDKKARKVIALDVNEGPLKAAKQHILEENLADKIETRLSNGLHKVNVSDGANAVVIAGMGGKLTLKILSEAPEVVQNLKQMVLEPQSELDLVRKWIRENGFHIEKETLVFEDKYYFIMDVRPGADENSDSEYGELFDCFSGYLLKKKDPLLRKFLKEQCSNLSNLYETASERGRCTLAGKISFYRKALRFFEE